MSELQPNASARDSSLSDESLLTDLPPVREGLPAGYRMRAEAHYVDDLAERSVGPVIRMISTHAIQADHVRNRAELEPLVRSIAAHGVLQPLLVRGDGPSYIAVAGRSRLEAARLAGLTTVPCVILSPSTAARPMRWRKPTTSGAATPRKATRTPARRASKGSARTCAGT